MLFKSHLQLERQRLITTSFVHFVLLYRNERGGRHRIDEEMLGRVQEKSDCELYKVQRTGDQQGRYPSLGRNIVLSAHTYKAVDFQFDFSLS